MNSRKTFEPARRRGFTLIELLVVIAIISLLAGILIPLASNVKIKGRINSAKTQLSYIETAIESYKAQKGHYPPDNRLNPANPAVPPLFFELGGALLNNNRVHSLNNGVEINQTEYNNAFGVPNTINSAVVNSFVNTTEIRGADARDFVPGLKPADFLVVNVNGNHVPLLGLTYAEGAINYTNDTANDPRNGVFIAPWQYRSSNPTNNPNSYDLWIDLVFKGKTNRISNWSSEPEVLH